MQRINVKAQCTLLIFNKNKQTKKNIYTKSYGLFFKEDQESIVKCSHMMC